VTLSELKRPSHGCIFMSKTGYFMTLLLLGWSPRSVIEHQDQEFAVKLRSWEARYGSSAHASMLSTSRGDANFWALVEGAFPDRGCGRYGPTPRVIM